MVSSPQIAGGGTPLIVNAVYDESTSIATLDKTWQEIYDAFPNVAVYSVESGYRKDAISSVFVGSSVFVVLVGGGDDAIRFTTDTANGYPSYRDYIE